MKTIVIIALPVALCAFGQEQNRVYWKAGAVQVVGAQPINGDTVKGAPYSAEAVTETTQTLADGNRIVNRQSSMQYRDGMGRERREQTMIMTPGGSNAAPEIVTISDPVANVSYSLNTREHSAQKFTGEGPKIFRTTGRLGAVNVAVVANGGFFARAILNVQPNNEAEKTEDLGSQLVEGVLANGTRTTHTIPAGQIGNDRAIQVVDENWFSPELQMTVMSKHNDPREGETVYKLTNIIRAEPDPALFRVPPDYDVNEVNPIPRTKE